MPSNILAMDDNFPSFTGKESPQQQIMAIHDYLFQLRTGLQYSLNNLSKDNFNAAALEQMNESQKSEVTKELQQVYAKLNQLSTEVDRLRSQVSESGDVSGRVGDLEEWTGAAEEQLADLGDRVTELELDETVAALQETVTGEGGLQERVVALDERTERVESVVQVAEDGTGTLGGEGKVLHLVGQIYINGILYGSETGDETGSETGSEEEAEGGTA
ncbi:MAG: hypothetical protein IJW45_08665 [Oscillospiraceae bacterium]|nr:hypothetical protein [Oscillospiraceae bacterium]